MTKDLPPTPQDAHAGAPPLPNPPVIDVMRLLGDGKEAVLLHNGEPYRLRVTANNKLILTK